MGAAAFLMAEFIGVPYIDIVKAGVIPALLYFTGIWIVVHLEAKKEGMRGLSKEELPNFKEVALKQGYMILPLAAIIFFLVNGSTPIKAAMYGLILTILTSFVKKATRMSLKDFLEALENGARNAIGVAIACACAGMIVGTITLTGLGLKVGNGLVGIAGGNLMLTLFFTMITSLILGMGAPTTANYIITSTIAAPAIVLLGVHPWPPICSPSISASWRTLRLRWPWRPSQGRPSPRRTPSRPASMPASWPLQPSSFLICSC